MRFCINRPSFMIFTNWQILQRPANKRDCQQLVRPWSYRTQPRLECQSQNHPGHVTALHMSMYPQVCVYLHYRYIRLDLYTHAYIQSYVYLNVCISRWVIRISTLYAIGEILNACIRLSNLYDPDSEEILESFSPV